MRRADLSDRVVHWTRGDTVEAAFEALWSIIRDGRLRGGTEFRRGGYPTVCFTEAPADLFQANPRRYQPFGISTTKAALFGMGGRPVIYGRDAEFCDLPESYRWRFVSYDPVASPVIDFTWEREWRYYGTHLDVPPDQWAVLIPNEQWHHELVERHRSEEKSYGGYVEAMLGFAYHVPAPFPYEIEIVPALGRWL